MTKSISRFVLLLALCVYVGVALVWSETGSLVVLVQDAQKRPVRGVEIGVEGRGGSKVTGDDGKALFPLAKDNNENDWVSLQILHSPPGKDLVMVSPYDNRTLVPPFKNKADNFVRVVVVQRGDLAVLQNGTVLRAFAEKINKANAPKSADKQATQENPKTNLEAVAKQFGLSPDDLDKAIKAWGAKTTDPYEAGLAALYERKFDKATAELQNSLKQREEKLAADQDAVLDAARFLGQSLYEQGQYRKAAEAVKRALQVSPDAPGLIGNLALSLMMAGDYAGAEPLARQALAINEKALGPDHPDVAISLNNLAALLYAKGDYAGAEPLCRRALAIREKTLGPDHPDLAQSLGNLAALLYAKGDYSGAEPLYRRALTIREKALGFDHPDVAKSLHNLGVLLDAKGDYLDAEPLLRRALAINEKAFGPDHPDVAISLNSLALLLKTSGRLLGSRVTVAAGAGDQ
jgi:tetratricopeptide (TPR) repeat protein